MTSSFRVMPIYLRLEDCSFLVVWCISMFFNIVSTIRSLREEELIDEEHLLTNENCFFNPSEYLVLYFIFLAWVAMLKSSKEDFAEDEVTI